MSFDTGDEGGAPAVSRTLRRSQYGAAAPSQHAALGESFNDFCRLIENEIPVLRRMVRRWERQKAGADDLVQDTLLLALVNAHLWQPGSNLRGWLITIMRNRFLATLAKSARSTSALEAAGTADPGRSADAREARLVLRDVERALRRLPSVQRMAMQLVAIEDNSYEDAAAAMGMTVGAVRCHLARARERLRTAVYDERYASPCSRRAARMPALAAIPLAALRGTPAPALLVGAD